MNIFVLSPDPTVAAQMHCDKHVVKMIVEYAQLLSTAHRLLDGVQITASDDRHRDKKLWLLEGEKPYLNADLDYSGNWVYRWIILDQKCYSMTHANHPSAVWARETSANYNWLVQLFHACLVEYTKRYGKRHVSEKLLPFFRFPPKNILKGELTPFPQAMPDEYKVPDDPVLAYRNFYLGSKIRFAKWTNRAVPEWFATGLTEKGLNVSDFVRTR